METSLFSFNLPEELIAKEPPELRGTCRLMVLPSGSKSIPAGNSEHPSKAKAAKEAPAKIIHTVMPRLPDFIEPGTLMVFNDTRVRKARMFARNAETGGRGEFLFIQCTSGGQWDCVVDKAKRRKNGQKWIFPGGIEGRITGEPASDRRLVALSPVPEEDWFEKYGHIPLPPYMRRDDTPADSKRYQTVYARNTGSAAAPTAGLHFTHSILEALKAKGVEIQWVTLEVGLGTFAPVRSRLITDHEMHTERYSVPEETAAAVNRAKREGRPVLAVGTTSVRTLESAWNQTEGGTSPDGNLRPGGQLRAGGAFPDSAFPDGGLRPGGQLRAGGAFPEGNLRSGGRLEPDRAFPDGGLRLGGQLRAGSGSTRLFIYPGYRFRVVDRIFTNFHTPCSTLLMMISAFCGRERILSAYEEAVNLKYRFFSYGDAMLIH